MTGERLAIAALCLSLAACGGRRGVGTGDRPGLDLGIGSTDAGGDAPRPDGGSDLGGGIDLGPELIVIPTDLGTDFGRDFGTDFGVDGGRDAGRDSGTRDAGPSGCFTGRACDPVVGCTGGMTCQDQIDQTSTVYLAGGGTTTATTTFYPGGYCTNAVLSSTSALEGSAGACNPAAASSDTTMAGLDGCLTCARCIDLGASSTAAGAAHLVQCAERCTPTDVDNDVCRDGYQCSPDTRTCTFAECGTDLDCTTYVEDTDGDGACDTATGDRIVVDAASDGTCDTGTYRCRRSGTPGARAGDTCTVDSDCEADGRCLDECRYPNFVGGYCTKNFCDVSGRGCASSEKCFDGGGDFFLCLRSCTVDAEASTLRLGAGGHGDTCAVGYQCSYDNASGVGVTGNGGCLPGNYNALTANNIGHSCTADSGCYSPHGAGACIFGSPASSCSILGCAGYPSTENVCGTGNACFADFADGSSVCLHTCTTPSDCATAGAPLDHGCIQLSTTDPNFYCWPACTLDSDCQTGLRCIGATTTAAGVCG